MQIAGTLAPRAPQDQTAARDTVLLPFLMTYSHTLISLSQRKTNVTSKIKKNIINISIAMQVLAS